VDCFCRLLDKFVSSSLGLVIFWKALPWLGRHCSVEFSHSRHFGRGDGAMKFQSVLVCVALLVASACASERPAKAPATAAAPPPQTAPPPQAAVIEQLPPPPDVVNEEKPAPRLKVAKLPDPKAPSKCRGLPQLACINVEDCEWIKRASSTDRDGRPLPDYCGLKTLAGRERFNPDTASVRE
jgi:hypothetical protein